MNRGDVVMILLDQQSTLPVQTAGVIGVITDFLYSYNNSEPFIVFRNFVANCNVTYCYKDHEVKVIGNINDYKNEVPTAKECSCSTPDLMSKGCTCGSLVRNVPSNVIS